MFFTTPTNTNTPCILVHDIINSKTMSGHQNVAQQVEIMELTSNSQQQRQLHEAALLDLEARKVAATIDVPTLPDQVRTALRELGCPVRLFGENLANVRDRLRMELARRQVEGLAVKQEEERQRQAMKEDEEEVTKYTRASHELVLARQEIAAFSLQRAAMRLNAERGRRLAAVRKKRKTAGYDNGNNDAKPDALTTEDQACRKVYKTLRKVTLEGSQYGDMRALSCLCSGNNTRGNPTTHNSVTFVVATASWTGSLHLWDASSPALNQLGRRNLCHEDRIMGMDMMAIHENDMFLLATASIDLTGKLWKVQKSDVVMTDDTADTGEKDEGSVYTITEQVHLKGHAARLCRPAFHPMGKQVVTTSFDHTWRLWDIETGQNLLLVDGHYRECYGIGFHPDGSLVATTDFASVVQLWDLRTGKAIHHFLGHAKRVLNAEFHPNGFQLATSGDDGTVKIWDLRRRKQAASLPAHLGLVTRLRFDSSGEYLASSSFDGSVKLWSCRDWKMLNQLQGHDGKVSGVDILPNNSIVSCGFDKTLKLWR